MKILFVAAAMAPLLCSYHIMAMFPQLVLNMKLDKEDVLGAMERSVFPYLAKTASKLVVNA